jgi:hypothetical protein
MILRSLEPSDAGRVLPHFDLFIYTPVNFPEEAVRDLLEEGKEGFAYANVFNKPCPEWDDGAWLTFAKTLPTLTSPDGREAIFPWYGCSEEPRKLIGWDVCTPQQVLEAAEVLMLPHLSRFFDMFFPALPEWAFAQGGPRRLDFPPERLARYSENLNLLRALVSVKRSVLVNGDWFSNAPCYIEHGERNILTAMAQALTPGNVLSIDPHYPQALTALRAFYRQDRIISFSSPNPDPTVSDAAFAEMAAFDAYLKRVELMM